jgi:muramidase (phage lysozyme)
MIGHLAQSLHHENVKAFLRVIRAGESSQGDEAYRMMFGGKLFDSFDHHPNIKVTANGLTSTAAGAYQFLFRTWAEVSEALMLPDFSPPMQDLAAVYLINRRKALEDVEAGRIEQAIEKCNREWASLPGSPYGQPTRTLAQALATFKEYGGTLDTDKGNVGSIDGSKENVEELTEIPHIPAGEVLPDQPSKPMAPIIAALLPSLVEAIPKLGQLFGKSEVAQRNVKAAEIAFSVAKEALGATNEQEVVQRVQADPAAAQAVAKAVEANWYLLTESGGGGIEGARKANAEAMSGPGFWHNPAFWITLLLIAMPMMLLADVFYVHPQSYVGELRTQIVTALLAVIGMVGGYWIGTSFSSARKTEIASK